MHSKFIYFLFLAFASKLAYAESGRIQGTPAVGARPHEDILVDQPNIDVPSTKPNDSNSSSTKRLT